jgi:4a-hydroxytetrahydrobiopterin dehydratase
MRTPRLSPDEITARLAALTTGWSVQNGDTIVRRYEFPDFKTAMAFVNRLADAAEAADHHPDLDIRYNKVTVALSTHDSGGLTEKDFALAQEADELEE